MKKLFVYLSMLFTAMALVFSFSACGGDDLDDQYHNDDKSEEENNNGNVTDGSILGKWKESDNQFYEFLVGGKCYSYSFYEADSSCSASVGTYSFSNSTLTMNFDTSVDEHKNKLQYTIDNDAPMEYQVPSLSTTTLVLSQMGFEKSYTKVDDITIKSAIKAAFDKTEMPYDADVLGLETEENGGEGNQKYSIVGYWKRTQSDYYEFRTDGMLIYYNYTENGGFALSSGIYEQKEDSLFFNLTYDVSECTSTHLTIRNYDNPTTLSLSFQSESSAEIDILSIERVEGLPFKTDSIKSVFDATGSTYDAEKIGF